MEDSSLTGVANGPFVVIPPDLSLPEWAVPTPTDRWWQSAEVMQGVGCVVQFIGILGVAAYLADLVPKRRSHRLTLLAVSASLVGTGVWLGLKEYWQDPCYRRACLFEADELLLTKQVPLAERKERFKALYDHEVLTEQHLSRLLIRDGMPQRGQPTLDHFRRAHGKFGDELYSVLQPDQRTWLKNQLLHQVSLDGIDEHPILSKLSVTEEEKEAKRLYERVCTNSFTRLVDESGEELVEQIERYAWLKEPLLDKLLRLPASVMMGANYQRYRDALGIPSEDAVQLYQGYCVALAQLGAVYLEQRKAIESNDDLEQQLSDPAVDHLTRLNHFQQACYQAEITLRQHLNELHLEEQWQLSEQGVERLTRVIANASSTTLNQLMTALKSLSNGADALNEWLEAGDWIELESTATDEVVISDLTELENRVEELITVAQKMYQLRQGIDHYHPDALISESATVQSPDQQLPLWSEHLAQIEQEIAQLSPHANAARRDQVEQDYRQQVRQAGSEFRVALYKLSIN